MHRLIKRFCALVGPLWQYTFPDGVRTTKLYPAPLPDLFKGEQLVLAGRYSGKANGRVKLNGSVAGETREFTYEVRFPEQASEHDFIPRLWATRRVGNLLDEMRLHGENKELKDEVTDLARQYGIVTPYTAYLILEDEARRGVPTAMQSLPQLRDDRAARAEAERSWSYFSKSKDGIAGVANARSSFQLKSADNAATSVRGGQTEANLGLNVTLAAAPAASVGLMSPSPSGITSLGRPANTRVQPVADNAAQRLDGYVQNARFVAGKNFFQNGEQWIDADAQKQSANAQRVQLKFGSQEYFDFYAKNVAARPWLAIGRQVQFVHDGALYEVVD